jgi:hypothetical protein
MKTGGGEPEEQSNPAGRSVSRWIADVAVARDYRLAWLQHDAMAGISLSAVLVPAGMAYAEAPARGAILLDKAAARPRLVRRLTRGRDANYVPCRRNSFLHNSQSRNCSLVQELLLVEIWNARTKSCQSTEVLYPLF